MGHKSQLSTGVRILAGLSIALVMLLLADQTLAI